jgi:hypothetical protein
VCEERIPEYDVVAYCIYMRPRMCMCVGGYVLGPMHRHKSYACAAGHMWSRLLLWAGVARGAHRMQMTTPCHLTDRPQEAL